MQHDEIIGAGDALADVADLVAGVTRDVHRAVSGRAFGGVARGVGPVATPVRLLHDGIATSVHAAVRAGLSTGIAAVSRLAARALGGGEEKLTDQRRGAQVVGVLNGIVGDRMAEEGNALSLGLTLRVRDRDLPPTAAALAAAYPDASSRLAVFVHGLCETESAWRYRADVWHADGLPTHGERLQRDLGVTPLWVRCNTGRRVSTNGADLDALLTAVVQRWPVPVEEIAVIGHSLGGLIARSAVYSAAVRDEPWVGRVRHVVCLGTPHHGADLEKFANAHAWALGLVAETRPFGSALNRRSVGIKDLRYGNVHDGDWRDGDPDVLLMDTRGDAGLVEGIEYHVLGATFTDGLLGHLLGDGLVRVPSATGRSRHRTLSFGHAVHVTGVGHLSLLNHPTVYERVRDALAVGAVAEAG